MSNSKPDKSLPQDPGDVPAQSRADDADRVVERETTTNRLLRTIMREATLKETLGECLDVLLSVSWLCVPSQGGVFLAGKEPETLELFVDRNLSPELRRLCAKVPFGHCLCGRAAHAREIVHASCADHRHETGFDTLATHGHYSVPVLDGDAVLGVIVLFLPDGHPGRPDEVAFLGAVADIFALAILRKNSEAKLIEAGRFGQILDESLNEIYIFDPETLKIQKANRGALENLGYSGDEILDLTPADLTPDLSVGELRRSIAPLLDGSLQKQQFETRVIRKDGSIYPVGVNLQLVGEEKPVFAAILNDLSERKKTEAARRAAEERLANAIDALPDGFAIFDAGDRLVSFNQRYPEIFSDSRAAIKIGARFEDILRFGVARGQLFGIRGREDAWLTERLAQHQTAKGSFTVDLGDGRRIQIIERRTTDGGRVGLWVDITAFKHQQEALAREKDKAEDASRAKSEFLANMSHEICTPLNGIIGMAQLLQGEITDPGQKEKVDIIWKSGEGLTVILNNILDLAKIESGKFVLEERILKPGELSQRVQALHQTRAGEKGLDFEVFTSSSGDLALRGDADRVFQILHNLVENAIKFTDKGEVSVLIQTGKEDGLKLEVRDSGIGMTPEQIDQVFEDFTQADNSATRRFGGIGLGTGVVRRLVAMMGGTFEMKSRVGKGTTALVFLPLPRAGDADARTPGEAVARTKSSA
jgi:PAS domain S-box-containing protein